MGRFLEPWPFQILHPSGICTGTRNVSYRLVWRLPVPGAASIRIMPAIWELVYISRTYWESQGVPRPYACRGLRFAWRSRVRINWFSLYVQTTYGMANSTLLGGLANKL